MSYFVTVAINLKKSSSCQVPTMGQASVDTGPTMSSHSRSRSDGSTAAAARQVRSVKHSSRDQLRPQRPCLSCHSSTPNPNRPFRLVGRTYHPVVSAVPPRVDGDACLVVELPATTKHELCFASTMPVGLRRMISLHDRPCDKTNTDVSGTADHRPVRPKCAGG